MLWRHECEHDSDRGRGRGAMCILMWAQHTCVHHFETWVFSCVLLLTASWSQISLSEPWSPTTLTYARLLVWETSFTRFTGTGRIISVYFNAYVFRQQTFRQKILEQQTSLECNLHLISLCWKFWFLNIVPEYLKFSMFSQGLLFIFTLRFCIGIW